MPTEVAGRPKVVVLCLDGARADYVDKFIADGTMPNLAKLVERGVKAEYAQSIDPTLTAAAHASIATGTYPDKTGIVANTFRVPISTSIKQSVASRTWSGARNPSGVRP